MGQKTNFKQSKLQRMKLYYLYGINIPGKL
jgi:hypothetical protein